MIFMQVYNFFSLLHKKRKVNFPMTHYTNFPVLSCVICAVFPLIHWCQFSSTFQFHIRNTGFFFMTSGASSFPVVLCVRSCFSATPLTRWKFPSCVTCAIFIPTHQHVAGHSLPQPPPAAPAPGP